MTPSQIEYLQLVTQHQAMLLAYIRSVAPKAPHEDILQETNIVLWEKMSSFKLGTNFKGFACRIAYLKTMEALRSHKRKSWLVFDSDILETINQHYTASGLESNRTQEALRDCMLKLREQDRTLIHQRYTLKNTVRKLAAECGKKEGALQQAFFRIHRSLRVCIEKNLATSP